VVEVAAWKVRFHQVNLNQLKTLAQWERGDHDSGGW